MRTYGQGDVLATVAYMENELGLKTMVNKDMIAQANFVLKQIMPFYDRYCSPYFQGTDYNAVYHCMPGGATSSSQEGAMKQGYIQLLPHMLRFLAAIRKIVRYHDVTPGSQITWNTAFLAVTNAFKRSGEKGVQDSSAWPNSPPSPPKIRWTTSFANSASTSTATATTPSATCCSASSAACPSASPKTGSMRAPSAARLPLRPRLPHRGFSPRAPEGRQR